jgi:hypothetical protein
MSRRDPDLFSVARVRLPGKDRPRVTEAKVRGEWLPFEDWDYERMEPRPEWVIPTELSLITDDPDWIPVTRFG